MLNNTTLFKSLIFLSTLFIILYFVIGYFRITLDLYEMKFIYLDDRKVYFEGLLLKLFGALTLLVSLLIFYQLSIKNKSILLKVDKYILVYLIVFIMIVFYNDTFRPMVIYGMFFSIFIFHVMNNRCINYQIEIAEKFLYRILLAVSFYIILPMLIYITHFYFTTSNYILIDNIPQLYVVDSLRGFTMDRVQFGYITGLILVSLWLIEYKSTLKLFVMLMLVTALFLSSSRASIVALIVALAFLYFQRRVKYFLYLLMFVLVVISLSHFSNRHDIFLDSDGRINLLLNSIKFISEQDFTYLLFGYGDFYTSDFNGVHPHNSIIQSIMDFGIIVTFLWLIIQYKFFESINISSKVLFIYLFIYGNFHAGFSAFLFTPMNLFAYILIIGFVLYRKEQK